MKIMFSQYNAPFRDSSDPDIHYISLEDQRLMQLGLYCSHVQVWQSYHYSKIPLRGYSSAGSQNRIIEIYDPLSDTTRIHEINPHDFHAPFTSDSERAIPTEELNFLDELYYKYGIKTAGKRIGRYD